MYSESIGLILYGHAYHKEILERIDYLIYTILKNRSYLRIYLKDRLSNKGLNLWSEVFSLEVFYYFIKQLPKLAEKYPEILKIKKIRVKENALVEYLLKKDENHKQLKKLEDKLSIAKGFSGEFLASIYLQLHYNAKIKSFDQNVTEKGKETDIDVIAETTEGIILCQAKSSFPNCDEVITHFKKIEKIEKLYKKVLFVMEFPSIFDYSEAIIKLKENNIEIVFVDSLINELKNNPKLAKDIECLIDPPFTKNLEDDF